MKVVFLLMLLVSVTLATNIHGFMDEADEQAPRPVEPLIKTRKLFKMAHSLIVNHYRLDFVAHFLAGAQVKCAKLISVYIDHY